MPVMVSECCKPSIGAVRLDANRGGRGGVALQTCRNPVSNWLDSLNFFSYIFNDINNTFFIACVHEAKI